MTIGVGLVGARGYTGREMLSLIGAHPGLDLVYASSREWAGQPVAEAGAAIDTDVVFEALGPDGAADRRADVVILGLPNGKCAPFVHAIRAVKADTVLLDLSADHRADAGWVYGLPELDRSHLPGARAIANPGCYATAGQLALAPMAAMIDGTAHVYGVSGWSGAGTTPSRKNDPKALQDNIQPYALMGHNHEPEMARGAGVDVRFLPSVGDFFRGLVVTVSARLRPGVGTADLRQAFGDAYDGEPLVRVQDQPAEPAGVAGTRLCVIGGLAVDEARGCVAVTAALDNLLKGAASQAMQNLNLALGFDEQTALDARSPIAHTR